MLALLISFIFFASIPSIATGVFKEDLENATTEKIQANRDQRNTNTMYEEDVQTLDPMTKEDVWFANQEKLIETWKNIYHSELEQKFDPRKNKKWDGYNQGEMTKILLKKIKPAISFLNCNPNFQQIFSYYPSEWKDLGVPGSRLHHVDIANFVAFKTQGMPRLFITTAPNDKNKPFDSL